MGLAWYLTFLLEEGANLRFHLRTVSSSRLMILFLEALDRTCDFFFFFYIFNPATQHRFLMKKKYIEAFWKAQNKIS